MASTRSAKKHKNFLKPTRDYFYGKHFNAFFGVKNSDIVDSFESVVSENIFEASDEDIVEKGWRMHLSHVLKKFMKNKEAVTDKDDESHVCLSSELRGFFASRKLCPK